MPDHPQLPVTRHNTPFRIGCTSYIYPDGLLGNISALAALDLVDDIELILFDLEDGPSNFPDRQLVEALANIASAHDLTYTVHLPLDLGSSPDGIPHSRPIEQAEHVIQITAPLAPFAYIAHLERESITDPGRIDRTLQVVARLLDRIGNPTKLAIENLESYDPCHLEQVFETLPVSRTLDIGHLWKAGRDPLPLLEAWLPETRVIHIHGVGDNDHQSLTTISPPSLDRLISRLGAYRGILTLEVFGADDFFPSIEALLEAITRVRDQWADG